MIKDLLQNKFTKTTTAPTSQPRTPSARQVQITADLKSIVSDRGDPKKNSERLRLMLPKVKYP